MRCKELVERKDSDNGNFIIELLFRRKESALAITDEMFGKDIMNICLNILTNYWDAEESKNDVLMKIWQKIPPNKPNNYYRYICALARNLAIDRLRGKLSKDYFPSEMVIALEEIGDVFSDYVTPETEYLDKEFSERITLFANSLPEKQRYTFIERYYYGTPIRKIAKDLSVSESSVEKNMQKTKEKLKLFLWEYRNGGKT